MELEPSPLPQLAQLGSWSPLYLQTLQESYVQKLDLMSNNRKYERAQVELLTYLVKVNSIMVWFVPTIPGYFLPLPGPSWAPSRTLAEASQPHSAPESGNWTRLQWRLWNRNLDQRPWKLSQSARIKNGLLYYFRLNCFNHALSTQTATANFILPSLWLISVTCVEEKIILRPWESNVFRLRWIMGGVNSNR